MRKTNGQAVAAKRIFLSLGSNLGDREANLARAMNLLSSAGVISVRRSSLYATEPVGFTAQPWFLNCAVDASTVLMPRQLLRAVQHVEYELGRRRTIEGGPRTIDIDILFYGASLIHDADLEVPHPRMTERRFVLVPLHELEPGLRHPQSGRTISELLAATRDTGQVRLWHPGAGEPRAQTS